MVELISDAYISIAETIQVRGGTANNVRITASATCPNQTEDGQCTNVLIGTEATYNITVELLDCTPINEEQFLRFVFYGDIVIEVEPLCTCECSSQPSSNNSFCNGETLTCGQCQCGNERQGSRCECLASQTTFQNNDLCRRSNTSEVVSRYMYNYLIYKLMKSSHSILMAFQFQNYVAPLLKLENYYISIYKGAENDQKLKSEISPKCIRE